jgi:8-oxo-dGTP diphosphatase
MRTIHVSGCAIIENSKLLLRFKKKEGHYEFPGGIVEAGETLEQTAIREVKEEIGCEIVVEKYAGCEEIEKEGALLQLHVFFARLKPGSVPCEMEPEEFGDIIWMPLTEYSEYPLASNVKIFCEGCTL